MPESRRCKSSDNVETVEFHAICGSNHVRSAVPRRERTGRCHRADWREINGAVIYAVNSARDDVISAAAATDADADDDATVLGAVCRPALMISFVSATNRPASSADRESQCSFGLILLQLKYRNFRTSCSLSRRERHV